MRACECAPDGALYSGKPSPLLWRQNGDAYCREGYTLRLATAKEDKEEKKRRQPKKFHAPGGVRATISIF